MLVRDRLNTKSVLRRKNMQLDTYSCVLCVENIEEDIQHIFFECPFSNNCWTFLNIYWDTSLDFQFMLLRARVA